MEPLKLQGSKAKLRIALQKWLEIVCLFVFQLQTRLQQQTEQLRQELESAHKKSSHQLNSRLTELEASCRELTEKKYKNESAIRDLKIKLVGADEVSDCLGCVQVTSS